MGAMPDGARLWDGAVVPYEINPDLGNILTILAAMESYEQQTNIRFVLRTIEPDFVRFSMQTRGNPSSHVGRKGGPQFLKASVNSIGPLRHEIGHAVGLAHEHQRSDRDDFIIVHPDPTGAIPASKLAALKTARRSAQYDFNSIMHYRAIDANDPLAPPLFESRTGVPPPEDIGMTGELSPLDREFLAQLYPTPPVIRRSSGEGGAGFVLHISALAVPGSGSTAVLATAVQDASGRYHLVRWRIDEAGSVVRLNDLSDSIGGKASDIHFVSVGRLFVAAMRDAGGDLKLICHGNNFRRLADSGDQAGTVRGLQAVAISDSRVVTPCISAAGKLVLIGWEVGASGSITRLFDSHGKQSPKVKAIAAALLPGPGPDRLVAVVATSASGRLRLSLWRFGADFVDFVSDSGDQMGEGTFARLVAVRDHLVVACRNASGNLAVIPFAVSSDHALVRVEGGTALAGPVREISCVARPYGILTAVINGSGKLFLIKWAVEATGEVRRLGDSAAQAGEVSRFGLLAPGKPPPVDPGDHVVAVTLPFEEKATPFEEKATVCTAVRNADGDLVPITWDDLDGPGESGPL